MQTFTYTLERSPLSTKEAEEMHEKGRRALSAWWEEHHGSWPSEARAEVPVQAGLALAGKGGSDNGSEEALLLRGALDRVDEMPGGVRVIDYKTGKPKSRNELMGATKGADGNYYRQLTFYKLLLARADEPRAMQEGVIEFIEPDEKGRIRTEAFPITDEEVAGLEVLIRSTAGAVLALSFWNDPCDEEECPWCALRFGIV